MNLVNARSILNRLFGGRARRREAYRRWLKVNLGAYPRFQFPKVSQQIAVKLATETDFIAQIMAGIRASQLTKQQQQQQQPTQGEGVDNV